MSTEESAQSIKTLTESNTVTEKTPATTTATATNETSSITITRVELEESGDKNEASGMKLDTTSPDSSTGSSRMTIPESASDFNQWLQSMLAVARLPGGLPIEFRRKLWLALAERYLKRRGVNWEVEKVKWLSDKCRADDEELGIQIVKDLHRTGHSLLAGASGQIYQAKLKKILMGYSRWNPEVGYCQGFNMLGAIILQVMDKCEVDSIKVMIFLIEGLLPNGYFCGGLLGLQADMAVFRELLGFKLPKLARHLQKLQHSTNEPSFEPPIINVFTMQWFLTLFCNCLPMSYVLRIWDLIMIEGSDILLRTALSIWKVLEDRIFREVRTADDFYCKMGTLSAELLNGTLIDSNRLIHMISTLGPISELHQLRQKHLTASYNDQKQLKMLYTSAETEESRIAVANAWATRRGSQPRGQSDREKIALDISILKKQYDKLRERQKQAHVILSSAVTKQHQQQSTAGTSKVNNLLVGKSAITSKGRKGPPKGAIPPVRNQKLVKSSKAQAKQSKPDETIHWNSTDEAKKRRNSMSWKELNSERRIEDVKAMPKSSSASSLGSASKSDMASPKRRSDSSSYSEDSECESSPSTSLCDDDITSSLEVSPMKKKRHKDLPLDVSKKPLSMITIIETSPPETDEKDCPMISISCSDVDNKTPSPIANFYLDLSTGGDITSISQLSPMPDFSSYFTAISPIQTPCNFFEFPDFSSFIMNPDDKFPESEDGVTNEYFERVFEENVSSRNALSSTPDNNTLMSKSFSPSILRSYEREETCDPCKDEGKALSKYITQKSFSMDEQSCEKEEVIAINRSYSDGTIINVDVVDSKSDGFQKIIAENSKILNKLITRTAASPPDASIEVHFAKLNLESVIIEEPKSPNNLSDVEEEIAAIDKADDGDEAKEKVLISDIQDLANADVYFQRETTQNDLDASLSFNTHTKDENVTERNEKSINDEKETMATLACSPLENKPDAEGEVFEIKALAVREVQSKVEVRKEEEKSISPKFNEIQLMVTKLKEEMESQLKSSAPEEQEKAPEKPVISEKLIEVNAEDKKKVQAPKVEKEEKTLKVAEKSSCGKTCNHFESSSKVNDVVKPLSQEGLQKEIDAKSRKSSSTTSDLEKVASESMLKIDKSDSDMVLQKLNTQLDICQKEIAQAKEMLNSEGEKNNLANNKVIENKIVNSNDKKTDSINMEIKRENQTEVMKKVAVQESSTEKAKVEVKVVETKKNSNQILENLNIQLQRYEEQNPKSKLKISDEPSTSFVSTPKEKPITYETSAVIELAVLIKERELEKLTEQKLLMKTAKKEKDFDYELNLSPVRTPRCRSAISSPEPLNSGKFTNFFYDHEPRNDTRRRDISTLETEQRMRRPFKSSPANSLSSSPSNISNTLSSIQNTIKILDSACQKTDLVGTKKLDKAMESVEKLCDKDREYKYYKKTKYEPSPSFNVKIDDVSFDTHSSKRRTFLDDDKIVDKTYDLSPRRKRYDFDDEPTIYKSSKDVSPARCSKTPEIDPDYVAKLRFLSTEDYIAGRKSPLGGSRERLSGSRERLNASRERINASRERLNASRENLSVKFKIDRSPTSPTLSTLTHNSRSPRSPSHSSSLLRFPSSDYRSSKSAETSPSRYSSERVENNYKYNSASGSIDLKADSMSNLSYKHNKKYENDWETPSNKKKYDFY